MPENATAVEDGAVTQGADSQIPQTNSNKIQASQKQPQPNEQTGDSAGSTDKAVQMAVKQVTLSNSGSTSSTNRNVSSISDALNQTGSTSRANGSSSQQVRGKFIDSYTSVPRRGGLSSAGNFPTIKLKNPLEFSEFTITDPLSKEIDDCYSKTCTETFIGVFSSGNSNSSLAVTQPTSTRLPYQNLVPVVLLNLLLIVIFIRRTRDPGSSNEKKDESNVS